MRSANLLRQPQLQELREKFLGALNFGCGVRVSYRSEYFRFEERKATLLMDQLSIPGYPVSVLDRVAVDPLRGTKWGMFSASADAQRDMLFLAGKVFHVVAFVELSGRVLGEMCCKGIFCVLSQIDPSHTIADDTGKLDPIEHICCGQEVGREEGKVSLYPIECLVPVREPSGTLPFGPQPSANCFDI